MIIENYGYAGNYLILIFHDVYDVMKKTKDNLDLDESEEVYEYLLCAICPVTLTKPALGYREDENCIRSRIRDWVVGMPDTGFVFPAFTERSTDIHSLMFYTRDVKKPHAELMEGGLGCGVRLTMAEKKITFENIVKDVIGDGDDKSEILYMDIQDNLNDRVCQYMDRTADEENVADTPPLILTTREVSEVLMESGLTEDQTAAIEKNYEATFGDDLPEAGNLVDAKLVEANARRKDRLELVTQVKNLKEQLEESRSQKVMEEPLEENGEILLKIGEEKKELISVQIIDGKKCLVIPVEEEERILVNHEMYEC